VNGLIDRSIGPFEPLESYRLLPRVNPPGRAARTSSKAARCALLISLLAVVITYLVASQIFEGVPHIEDEIALVWQAQAIARGHLTLPTPSHRASFLIPFVVDYNGLRFGKYPLGWPALLAVGVRLGGMHLVNPLLAGLGVWLTYCLGCKIFGKTVGLIAAGLTLTSPFFLMNSGVLLSHPFGLVLSAAFVLAWFDAFPPASSQAANLTSMEATDRPGTIVASSRVGRRVLGAVTAGMALGILALTRPLTAVGLGLPFGLYGAVLLVRGDWPTRRRVLAIGALALGIASLNFLWQYAVTGDPWLNPYTLWWPYDKVGFGPGYGVTAGGHSLMLAIRNTDFSLRVGSGDLFGWGYLSPFFLPFGMLAAIRKRNWHALLVSSIFASLVLVYLAYWVGSWLFGPRYYYESLYSLTLISAAGIAYLAGWPIGPSETWKAFDGIKRFRPLGMVFLLGLLVSASLIFYTPQRIGGMHGLFGMGRANLEPFLTPQAQALTPALIIVHTDLWIDYGALLPLEDPFLDTPFIFAWSIGPNTDAALAADFPDRHIYHYYPDTPYVFYIGPR
jgi:hypothetical protein